MGVLDGEDVSDREHPQRRPGRAQREREDDAGRGHAGTSRRHPADRTGGGRHHGVGHRARGDQAPDLPVAGRRPDRVGGLQDQPARHAGLRRLHGRGRGGAERRRPGRVRRQRGRRGRGPDRGHLAALRGARHPPHGLRQQGGQGAGRLPPGARAAPRRRSAPASPPWSCPSARRARSTAWPTCCPIPGVRVRAGRPAPRRAAAARAGGGGAPGPRRAGRGDRLRRRRAARALPVRRGAVGRGARADAGPRAARRHGVPGGARLGAHRRRHRPPGRLHLRDRALPRRPPRHRPRRRPGGAGDRPTRPASRWPTSSAPSPTPSSASSRCSRSCPAPSRPTTT